MSDAKGDGVEFVAGTRMSASALPWSALEMTLAPHPYQLPKSTGTHLHIDLGVTGLGGNSCGQGGPLEPDRMKASDHNMSFIIRPVRQADFTKTACVSTSGEMPLSISRSRNGEVTISTQKKNAEILYTLNGKKKEYLYIEPFNLREGGVVTARYKDNKAVSVTMKFEKQESVPMTVVYASVTVAKYPHWVDFDAGEVKTIKGFVYLPRQDGGSNGNIKDYSLHTSMDGKNWTEVTKGTFGKGKKEQRVMLDKPVRARYIRFTGLSSQNGADFAGGAEFTVIAD